ncbi:ABC-type microcin C transport system duplicated ATPase subunit YejF [Bradyrhizobium sp. USDA 326]
MVFQDPFASLNPRQTIGDILGAPLDVHRVGSRGERRQRVGSRGERRQRVGEILSQVGLPEDSASRYAHEFSAVNASESALHGR